MQRQFSPLLAVREEAATRVIQNSSDPKIRAQYRRELEMYERYRGKFVKQPTIGQ